VVRVAHKKMKEEENQKAEGEKEPDRTELLESQAKRQKKKKSISGGKREPGVGKPKAVRKSPATQWGGQKTGGF